VDSADNDLVQTIWARYAPQIAAAQEEQAKEHTRCFHELAEEKIGELPAILLTLRRYATMQAAGCFDENGEEPEVKILRALWCLSPDFSPKNPNGKKFAKKHRRIDFQYYGEELGKYFARQFASDKKPKDHKGSKSVSSGGNWCASIVDTVASQYGWSEDQILDMPVQRLMAYINQITGRITGNRLVYNPEADRLREEFMQEVKQAQEKAS
jgi:hypothetical protein